MPASTCRSGGGAECRRMKKPKCDSLRTAAAAPNIIAVFMKSKATGSVQPGESLST